MYLKIHLKRFIDLIRKYFQIIHKNVYCTILIQSDVNRKYTVLIFNDRKQCFIFPYQNSSAILNFIRKIYIVYYQKREFSKYHITNIQHLIKLF